MKVHFLRTDTSQSQHPEQYNSTIIMTMMKALHVYYRLESTDTNHIGRSSFAARVQRLDLNRSSQFESQSPAPYSTFKKSLCCSRKYYGCAIRAWQWENEPRCYGK